MDQKLTFRVPHKEFILHGLMALVWVLLLILSFFEFRIGTKYLTRYTLISLIPLGFMLASGIKELRYPKLLLTPSAMVKYSVTPFGLFKAPRTVEIPAGVPLQVTSLDGGKGTSLLLKPDQHGIGYIEIKVMPHTFRKDDVPRLKRLVDEIVKSGVYDFEQISSAIAAPKL